MADPKSSSHNGKDPDSAGAPRWVKAFGIVALVLVLVFAALHLTGNSLGGHDLHRGHAPAQSGP
jgi:hypothetical protein